MWKKKNPPAEELPQHCSLNHLEIFLLPGNIWRDFSPQVLICWQLLLCVRVAQNLPAWLVATAAQRWSVWSLAHYRVTTVWLHVEADHTTLGKFCGEDCGPEGSCPHSKDCLANSKKFRETLRGKKKEEDDDVEKPPKSSLFASALEFVVLIWFNKPKVNSMIWL